MKTKSLFYTKSGAYLFFLMVLIITSCKQSTTSKTDIKESVDNIKETSDILANLPAYYRGTTGAKGYDSVLLSLSLQTNQDYNLGKEFYTLGKKDTSDYQTGVWMIEGENMISTSSKDKMKGFEKFKVVSSTQLLLVDSLGNELLDGNSYTLNLVTDSIRK